MWWGWWQAAGIRVAGLLLLQVRGVVCAGSDFLAVATSPPAQRRGTGAGVVWGPQGDRA